MTCAQNFARRETSPTASFAPERARGSLHPSASRLGPLSRITLSSSMGLSGPVTSTEANWTPDGLQATEARQAFQEALLLARREALASTARHLRNQSRCKEASSAMAELRAVTLQLLAMGEI